jgi:urease accessory protein UreF
MTWLSPAFPVGGYSYSHGLEWAVEAGGVRDAATLGDWIEDILNHGAGRSDVIFLAESCRAIASGDGRLLAETIGSRRHSRRRRAAPETLAARFPDGNPRRVA